MHKVHLRKLVIVLPCMAAMAALWALPALAVSESDVESALASQGKGVVSGNLFVWFLCSIAFLKVSTKLDSILQAMGLGVGRSPGSILAEAFMALRGMQAGKAALSGKMPGAGGHSAAAGTASAFSGGLAGMVSSKLKTDTAASMSGSGGGVTSGIGASFYKSTLGQDNGFASRVIGSVATGQTPGAIHGAAAEEAMQGYFAGTPDPTPPASTQGGADAANADFPADGLGAIPTSADGAVLDDAGADIPTDAPIPTSPLALEGDTAVPVSPGYEAEIAQTAGRTDVSYTASVGSGPAVSGGAASSSTIPTSPSLQQTALQRVLTGQMGNRTTDVEIGGGKITGREIIPGRGQIQFAMYNAKQFERPSGHYTVQTSRDGEQWYKVYATSAVERTPTAKDERGHYQYEERKVAVLPKAPARRQNRGG
ncbi:MAG TPA: hypothetical protein H9915_02025 [Candidatus Gemmiger faecigallinarum]|nr:hypothetical protein [Candidatus Gemmiger faecigallinarum]